MLLLCMYDLKAQDASGKSSTKTKRVLRMSQIARYHLSDENNPNNFPRLLGLQFAGMSFFFKFDLLFYYFIPLLIILLFLIFLIFIKLILNLISQVLFSF